MPYPQEGDFYEFWVDNLELGALGPGFPLFFILMQYLIFYLIGLTAIYFVPNYLSMKSHVDKLQNDYGYYVESDLAMISYGAYVMGALHNESYHGNMT